AGSSSSANADSASAGSNGTATLPQTGNSSNKAGIVAGSAMVMAMAGLGLSAKVVKQRKNA
ncbi:LPXTG cell wall anchor domain-containing protein, partial [Lactobacillus crispatus]